MTVPDPTTPLAPNSPTTHHREQFVLTFLRGDFGTMTQLCRQYCISRKTGYQWIHRFRAGGLPNLQDRSRAPHHSPQAIDPQLVQHIIALRQSRSTWGPKRLRSYLLAQHPTVKWPAESTIGSILKRNGLIQERKLAAPAYPPYREQDSHVDHLTRTTVPSHSPQPQTHNNPAQPAGTYCAVSHSTGQHQQHQQHQPPGTTWGPAYASPHSDTYPAPSHYQGNHLPPHPLNALPEPAQPANHDGHSGARSDSAYKC